MQLDQTQHTICGIHWREYTLEELTELLGIMGFTITTHTFSYMAKKHSSPFIKKIFYAISSLLFPKLADSITIITKKKEYKPMNFWFNVKYIKYIKM